MQIITRNEAKDLGLKFYFTGKVCKYGHLEDRRTSNGSCLGCEAEKEYKNKKIATAKRHYLENKDHRIECIKSWQEINKDKVYEYSATWRENNPEYASVYYAENKEYINAKNCEYKRNNKDIVLTSSSFRRASKINATPPWLSKELLSEIRELYKISSELTLQTGVLHHVDHIIPLVNNSVCGLHVPWNLQVITATENLSKGNRYNQDIMT